MKFKILVAFVFLLSFMRINAQYQADQLDSLTVSKQIVTEIIDLDSLLESKADTLVLPKVVVPKPKPKPLPKSTRPKGRAQRFADALGKQAFDSLIVNTKNSPDIAESNFKLPANLPPVKIDSLVLWGNPFFIDLVYMGLPRKFVLSAEPDLSQEYFGYKAKSLSDIKMDLIKVQAPEDFITELRRDARKELNRTAVHLYVLSFDELPDPNGNKNHLIGGKRLEKVQFVDNDEVFNTDKRKLVLKKVQVGPWQHKSTVLAQFSENTVSSNWYQGGNNNVAVLGILTGQFNYDNKKSIQWENSAEWRMGFNSIAGDTLRMLSTNDDVLKINSKLGIKAGGNWFYSGSVDFSTQFFDSYKGINSTVLKTAFLTPVRLNIGVGLDYKYKKIFSLMLSPVSYKYICINNTKVDSKLFGIPKGETVLKEIGSSFRATFAYPLTKDIQLDSKLTFYTNYEKVEIDCEVVCNMVINRFMSTRISINPRYDNTVIEVAGQKARWQFKQFMSIGFSHKFK